MLKTFIQTFKETLRKKVISITKYLIKTAWMLAGVVWIIWQKKKFSQQLCCFGKRSDKLKSSKLSTPWQHHNNCPLDNKCLTSKIAYSAEIITYNQQPPNVYFGISETGLKILFWHRQNEKRCRTLQVRLGTKRQTHAILDYRWSIDQKSSGYNPITKLCNLFLLEKILLILATRAD